MADIRISNQGGTCIIEEPHDRNGPCIEVAMSDRRALCDRILAATPTHDDTAPGAFGRVERHSSDLVALFKVEADADAYVRENSGVRKVTEGSVDGFDFKVVTV